MVHGAITLKGSSEVFLIEFLLFFRQETGHIPEIGFNRR